MMDAERKIVVRKWRDALTPALCEQFRTMFATVTTAEDYHLSTLSLLARCLPVEKFTTSFGDVAIRFYVELVFTAKTKLDEKTMVSVLLFWHGECVR
jgi:hypothetical protein